MKLSHSKLIMISGLVWFAIGVYLLQMGLNLLIEGIGNAETAAAARYPLFNALKDSFGSVQTVALLLVVIALFVGYMKGRYVLGKSAHRGVARILAMPNPANLTSIYSPKYYILIAIMIGLGMSMRFLGVSNDVRGFVDAIIGSALINGAMIYFKLAQNLKPCDASK